MKKFLKALSQNLAAVALLVGIIAALNLIAFRFPLRWDLTEEKEFTLSKSTLDLLGKLEDRLTFKLYYSKELPPQLLQIREEVSDKLEEIKAHAAKPVAIESEDPDSNEMKEQETLMLGITPLQVNIIEKDKRELKKAYMGMVMYYRDRKEVIPVLAQVDNLEYALSLNLLKLTQKETPRVGIVLPDDPASAQKYQLLPEIVRQIAAPVPLSAMDKDLSKLNLKSLLVVEPREVPESFVKELDALVAAGVNVAVFAGRVAISDNLAPGSVTTGLEGWLAAKGVGLSEKLLLDVRQNAQAAFQAGGMQLFVPYAFWVRSFNKDLSAAHPITMQLEEVLMPWTNVIETREVKDNPFKMTALVSSSGGSFLQQDEMPSVSPQYLQEMTETPVPQSYPLSVALDPVSGQGARIFVTANFNAVQDNFLQQSPSNAVFFQNLLEFSSWGEYLIGIRSRGKTARPLAETSDTERLLLKWGHMAGLPLLAVAVGLFALWLGGKRRHALVTGLFGGTR